MLKVQGAGALYVLKQLEQMPQVSADDPAKLVGGAGQDLDTTLRHLELTLCQRRNPSVTSRCQIYSPEATSTAMPTQFQTSGHSPQIAIPSTVA